jgi:hypothetical protein
VFRENNAEAGRTFEIATVLIMSRHEDTSMSAEKSISPINRFVRSNKLCL